MATLPVIDGLTFRVDLSLLTGDVGQRVGEINNSEGSGPTETETSSYRGGLIALSPSGLKCLEIRDVTDGFRYASQSDPVDIRSGTTLIMGQSDGPAPEATGPDAHFWSKLNPPRWYIWQQMQGGALHTYFQAGGSGAQLVPDDGWFRVRGLWGDGNSKAGIIGGQKVVEFLTSQSNSDREFSIGNFPTSSESRPLNGFLCEILHYSRPLSDSEIADISAHLQEKWVGTPQPARRTTPLMWSAF